MNINIKYLFLTRAMPPPHILLSHPMMYNNVTFIIFQILWRSIQIPKCPKAPTRFDFTNILFIDFFNRKEKTFQSLAKIVDSTKTNIVWPSTQKSKKLTLKH